MVLVESPATDVDQVGWSTPAAMAAAGITYRQLDHWHRCGYVSPSIADSAGSGSRRLYSFDDVVALAVLADLRRVGLEAAHAAQYVETVRDSDVSRVELAVSATSSLTVDLTAMRWAVRGRLTERLARAR